jgi:phytoene synthase
MLLEEQSVSLQPTLAAQSSHPIASPADYAVCHRIMRSASKNYSFASRFLPADRRDHVAALYALLRVGDDRVDVSRDQAGRSLEAIDAWERAYWQAFETGDSPEPVLRAYLNTALTFGIPAGLMSTYFRAMHEDLTITRFATFDHLYHYMEGSAIPVGRGMTYILGVRPPYALADALPGADSLSVAMQLSNFWRDIGQDWEVMGRIYIPLEDMERFGYHEADLAARRINRHLIELLEFEIERTEQYYAAARRSVSMLASGQWGVMSSLNIYHAILPSIRRNGYDVFGHRAGTGVWRKLVLTAHAWLATR